MVPKSHIDWYARQLEYEKNILATFTLATAAQIVDGKRWYPEAIKALEAFQASHNSNWYLPDWDNKRAAAVCAVLSPRITWASNITGVKRIAKAVGDRNSLCPVVAGVRRNVDKAWQIATGGPLSLVTGPKVSSFYANLCGNFERVTIDVWAARAAGVSDDEMTHLDRTRYASLERAYQAVAHELSFQPAELQAICWIVVRGKGE